MDTQKVEKELEIIKNLEYELKSIDSHIDDAREYLAVEFHSKPGFHNAPQVIIGRPLVLKLEEEVLAYIELLEVIKRPKVLALRQSDQEFAQCLKS